MNNRLAGTSTPETLTIFFELDEDLHKTLALIAALEAVLYEENAVDFHDFLLASINEKLHHILNGVYAGIDGEHDKWEKSCG